MGPIRTVAAATATTVVAVMPVFLIGASGPFVREDLGFDQAGLGVAVALFMGSSAVFAVVGGRVSERIGGGNALTLVAAGAGTVMLGTALLAQRLTHLLVLLALGGFLNSMAQPAGNLALARGVSARPALMFGIRQAAIPVATLLAGASVPLVSLTIGWRWAFALGAALALCTAVFVPRRLAPPGPIAATRARQGDAATAPLVALAVGFSIGIAAAVSLGSFLVESAVAAGVEPGAAGWLLVGSSFAGVCSRIAVGWLADRHQGTALYQASALLLLGAGGYGMLASGEPALFAVGAVLGYAAGWGWGGLVFFAVVRFNPTAPAAATGIVSAGAAGGAALGPLAFGYLVTAASFEVAWTLAAVAALASAGLVLFARSWLVRDRARRVQSHRDDGD